VGQYNLATISWSWQTGHWLIKGYIFFIQP
jgi:hypothetical protein